MSSFPSGPDLVGPVQAIIGQVTGTGVAATSTVAEESTQIIEPTTQIVGSAAGAAVDAGLPIPGAGGGLFGLSTFQFLAVGAVIIGAVIAFKK